MMESASSPGSAARRLEEFLSREMDPGEAAKLLNQPVTSEERRELLELVAWFRRRYPEPIERLRYVRRAYARWTRNRRS